MTTTLTRPMYGVDLTSPAARELLAFQAGETDTLPSTPFEDWCREQAAARRAGQDACWADLKTWLAAQIAECETWRRDALRHDRPMSAATASNRAGACRAALDKMTELESASRAA
jgi:hypothetical protein